jgi:hypothetical protein
MKRAILFRYHNIDPDICVERLTHLKMFNPGVKIYGLYGGDENLFHKYEVLTKQWIEHNYCVRGKEKRWKWLSSDLGARYWFETMGKEEAFDVLHIVEWDLLLLDSLENLYKNVPEGGMALSGLNSVSNLYGQWMWVSIPEWTLLLSHVRKNYSYNKKPYGSLGPGTTVPRLFLENYSRYDVPDWCIDEVRFPLFGQLIGCSLHDTGFYRKWFDEEEDVFFNCINKYIQKDTIEAELRKEDGRRAFHPFRELYYAKD